jgi:hypothetical protein
VRKLARLLAAPLDRRAMPAAPAGRKLNFPVHLICDLSHRLLAASPARLATWSADAAELRGRSLWRYATDEIRSAEGQLGELGWYDDGTARLSFWTGSNDSPVVPIDPGILVWERLQLSDGTLARLVTSVATGVVPTETKTPLTLRGREAVVPDRASSLRLWWATLSAAPSLRTHRFAMLLRMVVGCRGQAPPARILYSWAAALRIRRSSA